MLWNFVLWYIQFFIQRTTFDRNGQNIVSAFLKQVFILDRLNKMKFSGLFSVSMFHNLEFNRNIISIFADETWTDKVWHLYNPYISLTP
jgi:hypothetical protein